MAYNFGAQINLNGEKEFRAALRDLNASLKSLGEEFKLIETRFGENDQSMEGLTAKNESLNKRINEQKTGIEFLNEALKNAQTEFGETDRRTQDWQGRLYAAQTELVKLERELEANNKALEEAEDRLTGAGQELDDLGEALTTAGKELGDAGREADEYGEEIEDAAKKTSAFGDVLAANLASEAIKTSIKALGTLFKELGDGLKTAIQTGVEFESAFAGVKKTVNATEDEFAALEKGIRDMALEIPASAAEIAKVAEIAGQLGIETDSLLGFTRTMIDLGETTNLSAEEAASSLAKLANVTGMSQTDFDRLGSSIVALGNSFATTEADIVAMATRIAGAGAQVGMSEGEILGLATALSSVGVEAEMGGTAISKVLVRMQTAAETSGSLSRVLQQTGYSLRDLQLMSANNSKDFTALADSLGMTRTELNNLVKAGGDLENFGEIAGMSAEQFKKAFETDAAGALQAFIEGLGDTESATDSAIVMLQEMGVTETRLRDSLLRAAGASDQFSSALEMGNSAWEDNTALVKEADERYGTMESRFEVLKNTAKDFGIQIFESLEQPLRSAVDKGIDAIGDISEAFKSPEMQKSLEDLGRGFEQLIDMLSNIITNVVPSLVSAFGFLLEHLDVIAPAVGMFFAAWKISQLTAFISESGGVVDAIKGIVTQLLAQATATDTAAVAQGGLNTVMAANPLGLLAIAIAGVSTAYLALKDDAVSATQIMIDECNKLIDSINSAQQAYEEQTKKIDQNAEASKALADKIDELSQKEDKSAKEKEELKVYVDLLNDSMENLNLQYDAEKDALSMTTTEIYKQIEARQASITARAQEGRALEIAHEQIKLEEKINELLEEKAKLERQVEGLGDYWGQKQKYELEKVNKELDELLEQYEKNQLRFDKLTESITENAMKQSQTIEESAQSMGAAYDSIVYRARETVGAVESLGLETAAAYSEGIVSELAAVDKSAQELTGAVEKRLRIGIGAASLIGEQTTIEYAGGLRAGVTPVEAAAKETADTAATALEILLAEAYKTGQSIPQNISAGVMDNQSSVKKDVNSFAEELIGGLFGSFEGIENSEDLLRLSWNLNAFLGALEDNITGFIMSVGVTIGHLSEETKKFAKGFNESVGGMAQVVSLASVTTVTSTHRVSNAFAGLSTIIGELRPNLQAFIQIVKGLDADMETIGRLSMEGFGKGFLNSARNVFSDVKNTFKQFVGDIKDLLGIRSPSRVFMEMGEYVDEGFADGVLGMAGAVNRAMDKVFGGLDRSVAIGFDMASGGAGFTPGERTAQNGGRPLYIGSVNVTIPVDTIRDFNDTAEFFQHIEHHVIASGGETAWR